MPKISGYPLFSDEDAFAMISQGGVNYKTRLDDLINAAFVDGGYAGMLAEEFLDPGSIPATHFPYPWQYEEIGAGVHLLASGGENHPGIVEIKQSGANTGMAITMGFISNIMIGGEEDTEFIFRLPTTSAVVVSLGFMDEFSTGTPTDGAVIDIAGTTLRGRTYSGTVASATGTTYTISGNTWYRGKIVINSGATRVDFYLYDESNNLLWSDNLTTNVPSARRTSHGAKAYKTTAGTVDILDLDYMSLFMPRALTR